jgi:hypothetical protein
MTLGRYPDVSLAQARERHSQARKLHASGIDPMAQRKSEKYAEQAAIENSFQSVAALWLEHWLDGKSPRHVEYLKRRIEADISPCLGARHALQSANETASLYPLQSCTNSTRVSILRILSRDK